MLVNQTIREIKRSKRTLSTRKKKTSKRLKLWLLLGIFIVVSILACYSWVLTYLTVVEQQNGVLLKKDERCLWQTGKITIHIRNVGTSNATIDKVYINSIPQTSVTFTPSRVVVEDGGTITIVVSYNWQMNTLYRFQICPKTGETLTFDEGA